MSPLVTFPDLALRVGLLSRPAGFAVPTGGANVA